MIVVADTSPINYLILIGAIDVLSDLYHKIIVPDAVFAELQSDDTPSEVRDWIGNPPEWFEVVSGSVLLDTDLQYLDEGERQAIALCGELNADALIIDDRAGREEAAKRGIFVIGTLGVLNSAAKTDLLDLSYTLGKLRQTSFRASESLISDLLQLDSERKQKKA